MANYYTRIIRIYSKKDFTKINIESIVDDIVRTATMSGMYYYINEEEQYLDLKFTSKRASGEINLDYSNFDLWEIRDDKLLHNETDYGDEALIFGFDEIHFDSTNEILNNEFFQYFMDLKAKGIAKEQDGILKIKELGIHQGPILADIDLEESESWVTQVDLSKFLKPLGIWSGIGEIINNEALKKDMSKFDFFVMNSCPTDDFELYKGFNEIRFLWQGRIVGTECKYENGWGGTNSDWWDNCLFPEWLDFKLKK